MIYQDLYKRLEPKIGNKKKFDKLRPTEKESILKIAGVIARVVGFENVEIESRGSDIFFEDSNEYYLEVKTPQFFKGDRGDDLSRSINKFWKKLSSFKRKTLTLALIKPNKNIEIINRQLSEESEKPKGLLVMDSKFVPDEDIYRKLNTLLDKAASQLENIKGGRKIALIDLTYLFKANLATEQILYMLVKDTDILERLDGVSLFYHNQILNSEDQLPYTIGPTVVKKPWKKISKVFDHPHWGYSGNLIITTPNLIAEFDASRGIPKKGDFNLKKADKKTFFEALEEFDKLDSEERKPRSFRFFTHFYELKYNLIKEKNKN